MHSSLYCRSFAHYLAICAQMAHMSSTFLADRAGLPREEVRAWMDGDALPSVLQVVALERVLVAPEEEPEEGVGPLTPVVRVMDAQSALRLCGRMLSASSPGTCHDP